MNTTYYHGGVGGLLPGDQLVPPGDSEVSQANFGNALVRRDRVYLTTNLDAAVLFAWGYPYGAGDVYECELLGPVEPDPDYRGEDGGSVQCARALIVRVAVMGVQGLGSRSSS